MGKNSRAEVGLLATQPFGIDGSINANYITGPRNVSMTILPEGGRLTVLEPVLQAADCRVGEMSVSIYKKM